MIKISKESKIYLYSIPNAASGGPEMIAQLCSILRQDLGLNAFMYFPDNKLGNDPIHSEYKRYNNEFVNKIEDFDNNIVILPEIHTALLCGNSIKNAQKIIWFLSVDNYLVTSLKKTDLLVKRVINRFARLLKYNPIFEITYKQTKNIVNIKSDPLLNDRKLIISNSNYVSYFLKENGFDSIMVGDILGDDSLLETTNSYNKQNIVVYNPKKGFVFTKKIIKASKDILFIPLINMTKKDIRNNMNKAKVYIDFGNHPGPDRMPREATLSNCCIITGKRGSAGFFDDIPINDEYKFDEDNKNIPLIIDKIKECFDNYEQKSKDFYFYKNKILLEKDNFIKNIKNIFQN